MIMVVVVADKPNRRLVYTCEVLFKHVLQLPVTVLDKEVFEVKSKNDELSRPNAIIYYLPAPKADALNIHFSGFLKEETYKAYEPEIAISPDFPKLFPDKEKDKEIDFDLFAASFYLLSEYDKYFCKAFDKYDRYDENSLFSFRNKLHHYPLVHLYGEYLWRKLKAAFPHLERKQRKFNWQISIDVDYPWAYLNKGFAGKLGFLKDFFRLDFRNSVHRIKALKSGADPYDSFNKIMELTPKDRLLFFFLINRESRHDGRHTYRNMKYRKLIKEISKHSGSMLHPSYNTAVNKQSLIIEKQRLEAITNQKIAAARQHYLRYRLPQSRRNYEAAGIMNDYNAVLINDIGFPCGMAIPFPFFDMEKNCMTKLMIHPAQAMDVSLKNYMGLSPEEALMQMERLVDLCFSVNGNFLLLWHNNGFAGERAP